VPHSEPRSDTKSDGVTSTAGSANQSTSVASNADPGKELVAAFRRASEQKDLEAMLKLYCWDGVDAEMRETVRGNVEGELRQPVTELEIVPADPAQHGPRVEGGIRWRPSLPVVAVLKAKYAKAPPGSGWNVEAADYTLGLKEGHYRMTVPVKESP
jgi:hypothetical protein